MQVLIHLLKGAVIGIAMIIPGVSGGTMMLVMGIYERVLAAIDRTGPAVVRDLWTALRSDQRGSALRDWWTRYDAGFLMLLGIGCLGTIVGASYLMQYLLAEWHDPTYAFFFGIVLASVLVPYRLLRRRGWRELVSALVAAAITVGLSFAMSGEDRHRAAIEKHEIRQAKVAANLDATSAATVTERSSEDHSPGRLALFFFVGAIAISAMILPGVSGSFLLLLFGVYFEFLQALTRRDLLIVGGFALGCVVGIKVFAKLLDFLLARYYSPTMAFLAGLMIGSLWNLWPFKRFAEVGGERVDLANILPNAVDGNVLLSAGVALLGAVAILGFVWFESRQARSQPEG